MHGAKLSRESIMAGIALASPPLGFCEYIYCISYRSLGLAVIVPKWMSPTVYGLLYCVLYLRPYSQQLLSLRYGELPRLFVVHQRQAFLGFSFTNLSWFIDGC